MKTPILFSALFLVTALASAQESYGTIRSTTKLRPDGSSVTTVKDPEKQTSVETVSNSAGKVLRKTTYLLGVQDRYVGAIFSDAADKVIYKASYEYDASGRMTVSTFTSPDDRYLGKRLFIYGTGDAARIEDYDAKNQLIAKPEAAGKPDTSKKRR